MRKGLWLSRLLVVIIKLYRAAVKLSCRQDRIVKDKLLCLVLTRQIILTEKNNILRIAEQSTAEGKIAGVAE